MNTKEILNRLERIDHKEYSSGFEFADSSTFDEMARCFEERKILAKEIERLNNIINSIDTRLIEMGVDDEMLDICEMYDVNGIELRKMIKELKGSDKE